MTFLSILGAIVAAIALVHVKVKVSSVLVHHATHGKGLKNPLGNRVIAEAMSILVLSTPFAEYKRVHDKHHPISSFASMRDEEAYYLYKLGFQPGTPHAHLWRVFWRTLWSPCFHIHMIMQRLHLNFGYNGSLWRRVITWGFWLSVVASAAYASVLPGLLVGVLLPLLVGGNIASFLELASRHRWLVTPPAGARRQFALSHGRFLAPMPPKSKNLMIWVRWLQLVLMAVIARLTVVPTDLVWHIAHHIGLQPALRDQPAWTDAASAYSALFWLDQGLKVQAHNSILGAIDAWFIALAAEAPIQP